MLIKGDIIDTELFIYDELIFGSFLKLHDDELRGKGKIYSDENDILLSSSSSPSLTRLITDNYVYLPGTTKYHDKHLIYIKIKDKHKAQKYYDALIQTLINFNKNGPNLIIEPIDVI